MRERIVVILVKKINGIAKQLSNPLGASITLTNKLLQHIMKYENKRHAMIRRRKEKFLYTRPDLIYMNYRYQTMSLFTFAQRGKLYHHCLL
jgi:arginyl-tRNA synthetase